MHLITLSLLKAYLKNLGYQATYVQPDKRAFYNPRTRKEIVIPTSTCELSITDLEQIFLAPACDLPVDMEINRLKLYCCNMLLGMAFDPELFEEVAA
ncbi:MAG: hypothetical protein GC181_10740 [Bacteroidetes bacterium]|nr:hypothetical protein [Bacteroidota bacterium]